MTTLGILPHVDVTQIQEKKKHLEIKKNVFFCALRQLG